MRAFIGQFDSVSRGVFGLGLAIGAVWLVLLDLGVILAVAALLVGSVVLITQGRWLDIGLLMIGIGLVVQVGYWILGPPEPSAVIDNPAGLPEILPVELYAPGTAGLLLFGGLVYTIVVGAWELAEGRRRERLEARRARRRSTWSGES